MVSMRIVALVLCVEKWIYIYIYVYVYWMEWASRAATENQRFKTDCRVLTGLLSIAPANTLVMVNPVRLTYLAHPQIFWWKTQWSLIIVHRQFLMSYTIAASTVRYYFSLCPILLITAFSPSSGWALAESRQPKLILRLCRNSIPVHHPPSQMG